MVFSDAAVVFPERDIQAPVQVVFDPPVFSDGFGDGGGVIFEAIMRISWSKCRVLCRRGPLRQSRCLRKGDAGEGMSNLLKIIVF
jgi:hypothetical protein